MDIYIWLGLWSFAEDVSALRSVLYFMHAVDSIETVL